MQMVCYSIDELFFGRAGLSADAKNVNIGHLKKQKNSIVKAILIIWDRHVHTLCVQM